MPRPHPRPPLTLGRAFLLLGLYAVIAQGGELLSGLGSEELKQDPMDAVRGLVIPVGLGILVVLAVGGRWGWREVFVEAPELRVLTSWPRWLLPGALVVAGAVGFVSVPWNHWPAAVVVSLLAGTLLVGVGEELIFRGFLLVGARTRYSESGAFLLTTGLFGLVHVVNVLAGQSLAVTLRQIAFATIVGAGFYVLRRGTGLLVVPMLAHGMVNLLSLLHTPPD